MRLTVQIEFDKTLDLDTPKKNVTVGRSPNNDLVIKHDSVSRTHCRLEVSKGVFYVTDLGSSNGTFIDGQKLEPEKRTAFLSTQLLTIGKLDCEAKESSAPEATPEAKVVGTEVSSNGNYTATMRISRLDLNRGSGANEASKKLKPKGPRNPVTDEVQNPKVEKKSSKKLFILLGILILAAAYLFMDIEL